MRDNEYRSAGKQPIYGFLDKSLRFGIERRRGFVENENGRVDEKGARDRDALALSAGETRAALAEYGVVTLRQLGDEPVGIGGPGRGDDLRLGESARVTVGDVVPHRVVEEYRVLANDPR